MIPDSIDFEKIKSLYEELKFTQEEINTELNRYLQVFNNTITKEKYQKNKNAVITVDGKTITTNAYLYNST